MSSVFFVHPLYTIYIYVYWNHGIPLETRIGTILQNTCAEMGTLLWNTCVWQNGKIGIGNEIKGR